MKKIIIIMILFTMLFSACNLETSKKGDEVEPSKSIYSAEIQAWMDNHEGSDEIDVFIALEDDSWMIEEDIPAFEGEVELDENGDVIEIIENSQSISSKAVSLQLENTKSAMINAEAQREYVKSQKLQEFLGQMNWTSKSAEPELLSMTTLKKRLTKNQIEALESQSDLIAGIEPAFEGVPAISSAHSDMRMNQFLNNSKNGTDIGIFMHEAAGGRSAKTNVSGFDRSRYTVFSTLGTTDHATWVALILQQTATDAHIYSATSLFPPNRLSQNPPIYVANHSWVNTHTDTRTYKSLDRDFDNDIYSNRTATFASAGNGSGNVSSPGKAYNVITVGNYYDGNHTMASDSSYIDPTTYCEKPEIAAPGTYITAGPYVNWSGTSASSPFAAAFAANYMERYSWLKQKPYLVKAGMMAGAARNIEGSARLSDKDGAGAIHAAETYYTKGWWWEGGNSAFFDSDNYITKTYSLTGGSRYRVVLSWLVPGSYAYSNNRVNMRNYLYVYKGSSYIAGSTYTYNNFQIIDFTAPSSGTYTFKIRRAYNSGTGSIRMGMALNQIAYF